jgi:hypothetical protein
MSFRRSTMTRNKLVLFVGLLSLLAGGAGVAAAADPQAVGQEAINSQTASSIAASTQTAPTNQNIDVRIFSPGDAGAVTQTNASEAASAAANANATDQSAQQQQAGGGSGTQAVGQAASSQQGATSRATSTQVNANNNNISVRIDSPGSDGPVTQTNTSAAKSAAANANRTKQSAGQTQAGGACCAGTSGGSQAVGQKAGSAQKADSSATSSQTEPTNRNISVRIDSPGNAGPVTQTNTSAATSAAANANQTDQKATQQQAGGACCGTGGRTQAAGQAADNDQSGSSGATSTQMRPSNANIPVRIGSPGNDGPVTQVNGSAAESAALNANKTDQAATQQQGGACCTPASSGGTQAIGQAASNKQGAGSRATSTQVGASNTNTPVRIGSAGNGGSVEQTNASAAMSAAANLNATDQDATQNQGGGACCGSGSGTQAVGQAAYSAQNADSDATSTQQQPSNSNAPVRIGSAGDDGSVQQTNGSAAGSLAANLNATKQSAGQTQAGATDGVCCSVGTGIQAVEQKAGNVQDADSSATSTQEGARNSDTPVRIGSPGNGGSVQQANLSVAGSAALNANAVRQDTTQTQGGGACCVQGARVQAAGQFAEGAQKAGSKVKSEQITPSTAGNPVRIESAGGDGTARQTNVAAAESPAANANATKQVAGQTQTGGRGATCCVAGARVQAVGQKAGNGQSAGSTAGATQTGAGNANTPVRIGSPGAAGSVCQTNLTVAASAALNANLLDQSASQDQAGGLGTGVQAIGQKAGNDQKADSNADSTQREPCNTNARVRIGSAGNDGTVEQANVSTAGSLAANLNRTSQSAGQKQAGVTSAACCSAGIGVQAVGQLAGNQQSGNSSASSNQDRPSNSNAPVRIWSAGDAGSVAQTNASLAESVAANANELVQSVTQQQGGTF